MAQENEFSVALLFTVSLGAVTACFMTAFSSTHHMGSVVAYQGRTQATPQNTRAAQVKAGRRSTDAVGRLLALAVAQTAGFLLGF